MNTGVARQGRVLGLVALLAMLAIGANAAPPVTVTSVAAGGDHTCALTSDGGVLCWGANDSGQLGNGLLENQLMPVPAAGMSSGVVQVAVGYAHSCALTAFGAVHCWGGNAFGQLGDGTTGSRPTAGPVVGLATGVSSIAAGANHTCALMTAGTVVCWGENGHGELGDGTTTQRSTPVPVNGIPNPVVTVAAGWSHTCAIVTGGALLCWGDNEFGQLGVATAPVQPTPVAPTGLGSGVASVAGGLAHTCAVTTAGAVLCWGNNLHGELGDGTTVTRTSPMVVSGFGDGGAAVTAGAFHTCAVTTGGGALCWGGNADGELGDGSTNGRPTPGQVNGLAAGVSKVSTQNGHACAVTAGGGVVCWGYNLQGNLGDGTTSQRTSPVAVIGLEGSPVLSVRSASPGTGLIAGGQTVTISGNNFATGLAVTFGGAAATGVTVVDSGTVTATTPAHAAGLVDLVVTNPDSQQVTLVGGYRYLAPVLPVDFGGAGRSDIAVFRASTGEWWIHGQADPVTFGQAGDMPVPADYNGDGKAELAIYRPTTSEWTVRGAAPGVFGAAGDIPVPADYNGDGVAEIAVFRPSSGDWIIAGSPSPTYTRWGQRGDIPAPADYNGDGVTEIAVFRPTTGTWYVMNGPTLQWGMWGDVPAAADYDGDGKAEIAVYRPSSGWWYVANGPAACWGAAGDVPVPLDMDGDGKVEFSVFRPSDGTWWGLNATTSAVTSLAWGQTGDEPVGRPPFLPAGPLLKTAGDFDRDGAADLTVFRPTDGHWYTLKSTSGYREWVGVALGQDGDIPVPGVWQATGQQERAVYRPATGQWLLEDGRTFTLGAAGDVPVPADYDGDGIMDLGVFTPATAVWTGLMSKSGYTETQSLTWGAAGDVPVPGDYDGDGHADLAVFTPATGLWRAFNTESGTEVLSLAWGMEGDIPVPADFDGDGKTDLGIYRPSTGWWYGLMSSAGRDPANYESAGWGAPGDIPVAGDYNGDGQVEPAVYRPSNGAWYVMDVMTITGWGAATDLPVLGRK